MQFPEKKTGEYDLRKVAEPSRAKGPKKGDALSHEDGVNMENKVGGNEETSQKKNVTNPDCI